jgi:hypothetical protein
MKSMYTGRMVRLYPVPDAWSNKSTGLVMLVKDVGMAMPPKGICRAAFDGVAKVAAATRSDADFGHLKT